jgi:hypothetical protein
VGALGALLVVAVGCVEPPSPADRPDEEVRCGTGPLALLIGESVSGGLVPMDALVEPSLVHGPQGGHHLNLAVQVTGLGPAPADLFFDIEAILETADGEPLRVGGFVAELGDPRPSGDASDAVWLDLWLIVTRWPVSDVRAVSAVVEELSPCTGMAAWDHTFRPSN